MTNICLFQNTFRDLAECGGVLEEDGIINLRGDELRCAVKLIQMCRDISEQWDGVDLEKYLADFPRARAQDEAILANIRRLAAEAKGPIHDDDKVNKWERQT